MGKAENKVEGYLKDQAEANGFIIYKFMSGHDGVPDRILVGHGHTVFVETKAPEGRLRPLQKAVIELLDDHGAEVYVAFTREQVDKLIARLITNPRRRPKSANKKGEYLP